eukprot:CAMPEP_0177638160 /NCGR_PEP_ID=MMETSP0447-20121125/5343_1 /TAXON_ID=0 /ORGANISM="Stygamoeba regulata, Strain BSH-02190019" /LENGTH=1090 /DNA_ID=CAMNT_0019140109 /DNA_START=389 /DNA_END=3662 /DNA_ORIENTATION=-
MLNRSSKKLASVLGSGGKPDDLLKKLEKSIEESDENAVRTTVKLLCSTGINISGPLNLRGRTPLHLAVERSSANCALILLEAGANISARDLNGVRPYDLGMQPTNPRLSVVYSMVCFGELDMSVLEDIIFLCAPLQLTQDVERILLLAMLDEMLKAGLDLQKRNSSGLTPLHAAIVGGNSLMCMWLCARGVDPNAPSNSLEPLTVAVLKGQVGISEILIEHGADTSMAAARPEVQQFLGGCSVSLMECLGFTESNGLPPMSSDVPAEPLPSISDSTKTVLSSMINEPSSHCQQEAATGTRHIYWTYVDLVEKNVLNTFIKASLRTADRLPFVEAREQQHSSCKKISFSQEAIKLSAAKSGKRSWTMNPALESPPTRSAGWARSFKGKVKLTSSDPAVLDDKLTGFIVAVQSGNASDFPVSKKLATQVHAVTGQTALHVTATHGLAALTKELVKHKANLDAQDMSGFTPLHCAVMECMQEVALMLIDKGANVNILNKDGNEALHYAARLCRPDTDEELSSQVIQRLTEAGAKVNLINKQGESPLHKAAFLGSELAVLLLLRAGADPNIANPLNKMTPLHASCCLGHLGTLDTLLKYGADPSLVSKQGTCLDMAQAGGHTAIIQLLFRHSGVDTETKGSRIGTKMRDHVVQSGLTDIVYESLDSNDPTKHFKAEQVLGKGANGTVYKAVHSTTGFVAALKKLVLSTDAQKELKSEIAILKQCRHPNIVQYYGMFTSGNMISLLMELCTLGDVMNVRSTLKRSFTSEELAALSDAILNGLAYLHENGFVHRDIKGQNVLMNMSGAAKLTDFGVSSQLGDAEHCQTLTGTPAFLSPEIVLGHPYTFPTDIWSFGITLIQMADSEPPYANMTPLRLYMAIGNDPPPTFKDPSQYPPEMSDFLAACLKKDPTERLTADALRAHPWIAGLAVSPHRITEDLAIECRPNKGSIIKKRPSANRQLPIESAPPACPQPVFSHNVSDDVINNPNPINRFRPVHPSMTPRALSKDGAEQKLQDKAPTALCDSPRHGPAPPSMMRRALSKDAAEQTLQDKASTALRGSSIAKSPSARRPPPPLRRVQAVKAIEMPSDSTVDYP